MLGLLGFCAFLCVLLLLLFLLYDLVFETILLLKKDILLLAIKFARLFSSTLNSMPAKTPKNVLETIDDVELIRSIRETGQMDIIPASVKQK